MISSARIIHTTLNGARNGANGKSGFYNREGLGWGLELGALAFPPKITWNKTFKILMQFVSSVFYKSIDGCGGK